MSSKWFQTLALAVTLIGTSFAIAACGSSMEGTWADSTGTFVLEVKSGGSATIKYSGSAAPCTYTTGSNSITLNCQGQPAGVVLTVQPDGSLSGGPDNAIPALRKK
jgi:hypothetical protein